VGQHRSTQRLPAAARTDREQQLRARLRAISKEHPRWGWRKAHAIARREGLVVNKKRTRRLWREEGLRRPQKARKRRRVGEQRGERIEAARPDHVWALDFQHDLTSDGRQLQFLNIRR